MKRMKSSALFATVFAVMSLTLATANAATINIVNLDGAGEGFNDPTPAAPVGGNWGTTIGQQRLIAFTYAANIWAACIQSNVTITVNAQMNPLTCSAGSAVLGSAGATTVHANFAGAPAANTWYPQALANSLAGVDLSPANPDINAQFNSNLGQAGCLTGIFFYYGLDGNPGGNIDFASVVVHEIGHGLGFQTFVSQAGAKLAGFNDHYMIFLENHGAVPADYPSMTDVQRAAANIADPNLHWSGPLVTTAGLATLSGGTSNGHVRMHGPNSYQPGSSVSHWSTALSPDELMEPVYTAANHNPGLAWTLMDEIGWTLSCNNTNGCQNAAVDLKPANGTLGSAPDDSQERGAYVTAIKNFQLCSIGMEADLYVGENITVRVYAATGTTRGALLASGTTKVEHAGMRTHYVPVSYLLQECKEYDITFQFDHTVSWPYWSEPTITQRPYDIGGVIRVRDAESFGDAGNFALPHYKLQGSAPTVDNQSDVLVTHNCDNSFGSQHGAFVTAKKTHTLSKLGVDVTYASAPATLRAYVYEATGNVRGALVAEGTVTVPSMATQLIQVPINAVLREGQQYNVGFEFGASSWRYCHLEAFPWQFAGLWTMDMMEVNGVQNGGTPAPPAFHVTWSEGPGGDLLDLVGPWHNGVPDSPNVSQDNIDYGIFVTATATTDVFSVGWYADVPPGQVIGANVYAAVGNTRGALISSGTVLSGAGGKTWHDIPVSARLAVGQDYDIEIDIGQVDAWDCWNDNGDKSGPPLPYNAYGLLNVRNGESGGVASNYCLIDMRVGACSATVTGVAGGPAATPKFALYDAYPNPFSGTSTLRYELDEAATVSVQVYDVAGRKVADVMKSKALPKGQGQLSLDAGKLASGVYFVKMSTPGKSTTRKITIIR